MLKKQRAALSPDLSSPFEAGFSTRWSAIAPSESHPPVATPVAESAISRSPQGSPIRDHGISLLHNHTDVCLQSQSFSPQSSSFASWSSAPATCLNVDQSPRTILSAARTDPLNAPPMDLDMDGQKSFDCYANDMPACSYGTHSRLPTAHNWYTSVLEEFISRPTYKEIHGGGPAAFATTRPGILVDLQAYTLSGYETRGPSLSSDQRPLAAIPLGLLPALLTKYQKCYLRHALLCPVLSGTIPNFSRYAPPAMNRIKRPWFIGRMLKIAKCLSAKSWHAVTDFLFSCLTLQIQEPSFFLWEADLRQEILNAQLACNLCDTIFD